MIEEIELNEMFYETSKLKRRKKCVNYEPKTHTQDSSKFYYFAEVVDILRMSCEPLSCKCKALKSHEITFAFFIQHNDSVIHADEEREEQR